MKLRWKRVTNRDYVAKYKDFVFRLHLTSIGVYSMGRAYTLQVRKKDDVVFKSLGVAFWTVEDGGYDTWREESVDGKIWNSTQEILARATEILNEFGYLD